MRQQRQIRQIAEQLVQAGLTSFEIIEQVAEEYKIPAVSLFLEVNDIFIKMVRPDIWEALSDNDNNLEDDLEEYIE